MKKASSPPRRILVIRNRFLGDTVLAIPALRNLRYAFPDSRIEVIVEPVSGDLLQPCPYVDELIYWLPRKRSGKTPPDGVHVGIWSMAGFLRRRGYGRCYVMRRSFSAAVLPLLAGIPVRVGFSTQGRGLLLSRSLPVPDAHECERFLALLEADDIPVRDKHNEGWSTPEGDRKVAQRWPEPATDGNREVFICGKSTHPRKDLSAGKLASIARWLIEEAGARLHVCDAPHHAAYYSDVRDRLPENLRRRLMDWSSELTLVESLSLFRRMDAAVGVDTGLLHLAAQFSVPVLALFATADPGHWHPWGTAHRLLRAPRQPDGGRPLEAISVKEVGSAFTALMENSRRDKIADQ